MVERVTRWRLRKCSDLDREYAYYELLHEDSVLLEVAASDEGQIEVLFESAAPGHVFSIAELERALSDARSLIMQEIENTKD